MWVARDKDGRLTLFEGVPIRDEEKNIWTYYSMHSSKRPKYEHDFSLKILDRNLFSYLKWEDEPIEVEINSIKDLLDTQKELKEAYHNLIEYQTKQIQSLTRVFRGVPLEEVVEIIHSVEDKIHHKYEMIGNPDAEQNIRQLSIATSSMQPSDNSLREYIVDDKVVATVYVRRNDFNNADILVSDLGDEYNVSD